MRPKTEREPPFIFRFGHCRIHGHGCMTCDKLDIRGPRNLNASDRNGWQLHARVFFPSPSCRDAEYDEQ